MKAAEKTSLPYVSVGLLFGVVEHCGNDIIASLPRWMSQNPTSIIYCQNPCFVLKNLPLREIYIQSMTTETGESYDEKRQRQMMPWHNQSVLWLPNF